MNERLYRSRKSRVLGGVAGGLAEYFKIDPVIVRVAFVVACFFHGIGFFAYLVLWIAVPETPINLNFFSSSENPGGTVDSNTDGSVPPNFTMPENMVPKKTGNFGLIAGIILISMGALFLLDNFFCLFDFIDFFPVLMVILGIFLIFTSIKK